MPPAPAQASPSRWMDRGWLTLLALAPLLPFLSKPFHIDDPVYLAVARQIREQPLRPFDFTLNWYGTPEPMWSIMLNPPGLGYLLSPLTALFGESEALLHAAFLLFPLLAVHSAYAIARRFTPHPFAGAILFAVAPMFAVSGTTLMADIPALAFALAALALLLSAVEGRRGAATLSGIAASVALLVKYNSVFVIPLLVLAAILFGPRPLRQAPAVLLPLLVLLLWEALNLRTHGASHLLNALRHVEAERLSGSEMVTGTAAFLFLGTGSAPVLLGERLRRRAGIIAAAVAIPVAAGLVHLYGKELPFLGGWGLRSVATTLAAAGGLAWAGLILRDGMTRRREDLFLLAWVLGGLLQAVVFSYFVAARFLLPVLLPAILLGLRYAGGRTVRVAIALSLALSLLVGAADFEFASAYRQAARLLHERFGSLGQRLLFREHWGFQYYLEREGHRALDKHALVFEPGDRMALLQLVGEGRPLPVAGRSGERLLAVPDDLIEIPSRVPATVMRRRTGAGFYSSIWGPLPFSWGDRDAVRIQVYRIGIVPPVPEG